MEQAEIYLHKERDIKSFIQCHEALMKIENTPQGHMYMALGDAYMKAGLYRQALEAYSNGLEICPHEEKIARSVGDTLIFLHEYQKATGHYEHFLEKNPGNIKISLELSSLYMSTNQLSKAHRILALLIEKNDASSLKDPQQLSDYVILFLNLSKVLFYQGEYIKSKETLMKAINLAKKFTKIQLSKPECCDKIKEMISSLVVDLTDKLRKQDNTLEGLNLCEAAIEYTEGDERILFPTIKLLVVARKIDECRAYCKKLQLINPAHEGTIIVLGNLLVSQSQFDEAQSHYRDVIEKYPHSYEVIYEYLNLLKRMDREDEMKAIIESLSADFSNKKETAIVGGYNLCQVRKKR
jgi:tetratricopeptide (TPR) repeat protein